MHVISKRKGWTAFNIFRTALCVALAIGLGLVPLLTTNEAYMEDFMGTPWMLPSITLAFFVVLLLTHVPHPSMSGVTGKLERRGKYREVEDQMGDHKENHPLHEASPPPIYGGSVRSGQHDQHGVDVEGRRSGYVSRDEVDIPETPGYGEFADNHRVSYMSTRFANLREDEFDDVVDYERMHGNHRATGLDDWERNY
jgi:hypothetical protein